MNKPLIWLSFLLACVVACNPVKKEEHGHSHEDGDHHHNAHYSQYDTVLSHKLILPSKVPDRIIANLTATPSTSIGVNWRTSQQITEGFIEVALDTDGPEFLSNIIRKVKAETEVFENKHENEPLVKANYHSVVIDGLEPGKTYVYRVGATDKQELWSEWFQFTTASDKKGEEFSFIYFGDAQNQVKSMWSKVIRSSYKQFPQVDFMLHAGDLINSRQSNLEWGEWFYAGDFIHSTVPSIMTPGNHEYKNEVLTPLWRPQFTLPQNGPLEELLETCFVVDYQDLKMISLDALSYDDKPHSRKAQTVWLDSILANNDKKWTAITLHYPIFSTKENRDNKNVREGLKPLIDKYKVDIVLTGHDHTYARGQVSNDPTGATSVSDAGTIYAVSVSGPKMYDSMDADWMERRGEFTQLFQIITIKGDVLTYQAFTPIGTLYDAFDLVKSNGKKKLVNKIPKTAQRFKSDFVK